jgi:hypothetical protein
MQLLLVALVALAAGVLSYVHGWNCGYGAYDQAVADERTRDRFRRIAVNADLDRVSKPDIAPGGPDHAFERSRHV